MEAGVLKADGQAQTRTAGLARSRWISPPEAVEDQFLFPRFEANAMISHGDGHSVLVGSQGDDHGSSLTVFQSVAHEIAQHTLDPTRIDLGDDRVLRSVHGDCDVGVLGQGRETVDDPPNDRVRDRRAHRRGRQNQRRIY